MNKKKLNENKFKLQINKKILHPNFQKSL